MKKVVYQDGDYTKVARGSYTEDDTFVTVDDGIGHRIRINKRFVISIKDEEE
jgi:hypothetical protein